MSAPKARQASCLKESAPKARQIFSLGRQPQGRAYRVRASREAATDKRTGLSPLSGWAFTRLTTRRGGMGRPNPGPRNSYLHVTGTPSECKEICKENKPMMLHNPGSRKTDRRHAGGDHGVWSTTHPQRQPQTHQVKPLITPTPKGRAGVRAPLRSPPSHR
jgi:hypothetical protein